MLGVAILSPLAYILVLFALAHAPVSYVAPARELSILVGAVAGIMAAPTQAGYGAAKAGLASLARTVAAEYARDRIRMNVVACGAIATPELSPFEAIELVVTVASFAEIIRQERKRPTRR